MPPEENPFDRDPQNGSLMRFMPHNSSLLNDIFLEDSPVSRLVKLNSLQEIRLMLLPLANIDIRSFINIKRLVSTEYCSSGTSIGLKTSDGHIFNVVRRSPKNIWDPIISDSTVSLADLFASGVCDYLVVGENEPSLNCRVAKDNIITAEQALEMVRIILTAHSRFYINSKLPTNEWYYYLYRFEKLYKAYQSAWTVVTYNHGKGLSEQIHDYLTSFGTRLEFICRAYDKVAFFSLKTANFDHLNTQLYHLVYFVMLITGAFDDLVHIIAEFYDMKINRREDISLRIPEYVKGQKPSKFYQLLQSKNAALHHFLADKDTQMDIKTFYPLRDSLQHRELPHGVQLRQGSETDKNVFELDNNTYERLKKSYSSPIFIIRGNPCFLDPLPFIKWAQGVTITLINHVLSSFDWDSVCAILPPEVQEKIRESNSEFDHGVGLFLGWPEEPLYF